MKAQSQPLHGDTRTVSYLEKQRVWTYIAKGTEKELGRKERQGISENAQEKQDTGGLFILLGWCIPRNGWPVCQTALMAIGE